MKHLTQLLCALVALALALSCAALAEAPTEDRAGNAIALPEEANSIVSLAPATTQIIESLGLTDKLVGVDTQSPLYVAGLDELPQFDMMAPDVEQIAALEPDIVFASGISYLDGDPFAALEGMGICVVDIPTSNSIAAVGEDVLFTAQCLGMADEGQALVDEMNATIDEIAAIGATIEDKKTVLFEISALPSIYSFGTGTFLDEMISIIGAENAFGDQEGWIAVTEEDAVASNPRRHPHQRQLHRRPGGRDSRPRGLGGGHGGGQRRRLLHRQRRELAAEPPHRGRADRDGGGGLSGRLR